MVKKIIATIIILFSSAACVSNNESSFPKLSGHYLEQKSPDDEPELFASGIVSTKYNEHSGAVFAPDGEEVFWSREINIGREPRIIVIMHMKQENGTWTKPELAPFNFHNALYNHINSISPDGKRLYYYTYDETDGSKVWVVDKTDIGWGEPRLIKLITEDIPGSSVNEVHETKSGNIYCSGPLESTRNSRGIVYSRFENGRYQPYQSAGPGINFQFDNPYPNHSPTVDPDERFMIFVSRRLGGYGTQDLYISYRQQDGFYGKAINLGQKINTIGTGNSWPQLSPDGKFLFFVSYSKTFDESKILKKQYSYQDLINIQESISNGMGNIYWVNTDFIEEFKSSENK